MELIFFLCGLSFFSSFSIKQQVFWYSHLNRSGSFTTPICRASSFSFPIQKAGSAGSFANSTKVPSRNHFEAFWRDDLSGNHEFSTSFLCSSPLTPSFPPRPCLWEPVDGQGPFRHWPRAITSRLASWFCNEKPTGTRRVTRATSRLSNSDRKGPRAITSRFASSYRGEPPTIKNRPPDPLLLSWHPAALSPWFPAASPSLRRAKPIRKCNLGVHKSSVYTPRSHPKPSHAIQTESFLFCSTRCEADPTSSKNPSLDVVLCCWLVY